MFKMKAENGRSINEMLMTLAIIGIISVGSVVGFRMAMTRYHVNNLIEDAKLAGFVVVDGLFDSLPDDDVGLDMKGKFAQTTPYTFKAFAESDSNVTFEILALNVPYKICEEVKSRKVEWLEEIKANGIPNICNENDTNEISFFFNVELTAQKAENHCQTDADCGECGKCKKRRCRYGSKNNAGNCFMCDASKASDKASQSQCAVCPDDTRFWSTQGRCISCDVSDAQYYISQAECNRCSNRFLDNGCRTCDDTADGNPTSKEECLRCPRRYWVNKHCILCPEGATLSADRTDCIFECSQKDYFLAGNGADCKKCDASNASDIASKSQCAACPDNTRFWSTEGKCISCDVSGVKYNISQEECNRCSNRYLDGGCRTCPSDLASLKKESFCTQCHGTWTDGVCHTS